MTDRYSSAIAELYRISPSFQSAGRAGYNPGLGTMEALDAFTGHPHRSFRSIHIAGTNGKGSTAHFLAAVLSAAGYRTGLYTSPHLVDFRERMKIVEPAAELSSPSFMMIPEDEVLAFLSSCGEFIRERRPSFFEITTAMAFSWFSKEKVDMAVIECGLGGRLDSTNVITPVLSVITTIGYDHKDILGDTLESIASEKAGIIKAGVPVVCGQMPPEAYKVISDIASEKNVPCHYAPLCSSAGYANAVAAAINSVEPSRTDLKSDVQRLNLQTVAEAVDLLIGMGIGIDSQSGPDSSGGTGGSGSSAGLGGPGRFGGPDSSGGTGGSGSSAGLGGPGRFGGPDGSGGPGSTGSFSGSGRIVPALEHAALLTGLRGRWETLSVSPRIICDIGHNENALTPVMAQLMALAADLKPARFFIIYGMAADKDIESVIHLLPEQATYIFTNAQGSRAMPAGRLKEVVTAGWKGSREDMVSESVADAVAIFRRMSSPEDLLYIGGSSYVVAEAIPLIERDSEAVLK